MAQSDDATFQEEDREELAGDEHSEKSPPSAPNGTAELDIRHLRHRRNVWTFIQILLETHEDGEEDLDFDYLAEEANIRFSAPGLVSAEEVEARVLWCQEQRLPVDHQKAWIFFATDEELAGYDEGDDEQDDDFCGALIRFWKRVIERAWGALVMFVLEGGSVLETRDARRAKRARRRERNKTRESRRHKRERGAEHRDRKARRDVPSRARPKVEEKDTIEGVSGGYGATWVRGNRKQHRQRRYADLDHEGQARFDGGTGIAAWNDGNTNWVGRTDGAGVGHPSHIGNGSDKANCVDASGQIVDPRLLVFPNCQPPSVS